MYYIVFLTHANIPTRVTMAMMLVSVDNKNRSLKAHNIEIAAVRGL
jgi:hypothetical protein